MSQQDFPANSQPLLGRRVLVTRPRIQARELSRPLEVLGATPIEIPTIEIVAPKDSGPLRRACTQVTSFDWIVFTSVNGVEAFMNTLMEHHPTIEVLNNIRLCAIGPATAASLGRFDLKVDVVPTDHRAEGVSEALRENRVSAGEKILLPRADIARALLPNELRLLGAEVTDVTAYRTALPSPKTGIAVKELMNNQTVDVVTFTSASTARNFAKLLGTRTAIDLLNSTIVASIGPITAGAAKQIGIETTILPLHSTVPALVDAVTEFFASSVPPPHSKVR